MKPNVTDQPKSSEPKPTRLGNRPRRKSDRTFLLKLALANARKEREISEMMDGLMDCDQGPEIDYD